MNVPLIQKPETNDINASLIVIRKQLQILNESVNSIESKYLLKSELNKLSADTVGGDGKYIESVSESNGIINAVEKNLGNMVPVDEVTSGNTHSVTSNAVAEAIQNLKNGIVMGNLDLNTYIDCGLYVTKDDEIYTNVPSGMNGKYFSLMVVASAKYTSGTDYAFRNQILYHYATAEIYTRTYYWDNGGLVWGSWRKVTFQDELGTSLDEQRIGTWIDGKPLYKRAVVFDIPQNGNYAFPINIPSNAKVVKWAGNFFQRSYADPLWVMHIPYTFIEPTNPNDIINTYVYYEPNSRLFSCSFYGLGQYSSYFNGQAVIYIEYTKG